MGRGKNSIYRIWYYAWFQEFTQKRSWDIFPTNKRRYYICYRGPSGPKAVTEILPFIMTGAVLDAGNRIVNMSHQVLVLTELAF